MSDGKNMGGGMANGLQDNDAVEKERMRGGSGGNIFRKRFKPTADCLKLIIYYFFGCFNTIKN